MKLNFHKKELEPLRGSYWRIYDYEIKYDILMYALKTWGFQNTEKGNLDIQKTIILKPDKLREIQLFLEEGDLVKDKKLIQEDVYKYNVHHRYNLEITLREQTYEQIIYAPFEVIADKHSSIMELWRMLDDLVT